MENNNKSKTEENKIDEDTDKKKIFAIAKMEFSRYQW
jgi:hypothetical protein